jgi:hypothetical protein
LRGGVLVAPWFSDDLKGTEVLEIVAKAFNVELTLDDWKNAGRPTRSRVGLDGADEYLKKLDISPFSPQVACVNDNH